MKILIVVFALLTLASGAFAAGNTLEHNSLALVAGDPMLQYPDDAFTCFFGTEIAEMYLILIDAWNLNTDEAITNIGGFECELDLPEVALLLNSVYPPQSINFKNPPEYLVGTNIPVVGDQTVLATLTVYVTEDLTDTMWPSFITPVPEYYQSIPGSAAITDANDEFSLQAAVSVGGDYTDPVFWFIPSGNVSGGNPGTCVVPVDKDSWSNLKAMYR